MNRSGLLPFRDWTTFFVSENLARDDTKSTHVPISPVDASRHMLLDFSRDANLRKHPSSPSGSATETTPYWIQARWSTLVRGLIERSRRGTASESSDGRGWFPLHCIVSTSESLVLVQVITGTSPRRYVQAKAFFNACLQ